jgi:hypothetical protein
MQLINKEVGKFVFERDPATFAGTLNLAQTKTATDVTFKTASSASIHAFANPSSAMADMASITWVLITREKGPAAAYEGAGRAAAAALRGEKEKQASAGSVTPPSTKSLLSQCGTRH